MLYNVGPGEQTLYGSTDVTSAAWRQAFTNYAAASAAHFAGTGVIWELWNEPDNWGISASDYMTLANQVIPAMRTADPNCTIIGATVWGGNTSFQTTCYRQGLLNLVNAVSLHPYRTGNAGKRGEYVYDRSQPDADVRRQDAANRGLGMGLLQRAGEYWAVSVTTAQLQGDYLARLYLVNFSQGIPLSNWYKWYTGDETYDENFGIVTSDYAPKPAYNEMKLLTCSLKGETFTSRPE